MKTETFTSSDWLTGFIYTLMRDVVPPGEMERIILDMEKEDRSGDTIFTNGYVANYAHELAERIRNTIKESEKE